MKLPSRGLITGLLVAATLALPFAASALSIGDIQSQIQALLSQVAQLQAQIKVLQSGDTSSTPPSGTVANYRICSILNRNLGIGARGDDVSGLQEFLQTQGYFSGNATGYFGPLTAGAVAKWQSSQGVSAVGSMGPISRARISVWCGNPVPPPTACKPLTYMPIACSDGSQAQPEHNEEGCLIGYECPVANYTPPASCKSWSDGCNQCARTSPDAPAACTMRACFAAGKGYCSVYFDNPTTSGNKPPVISGISGPTTLAVGATGTWTINATDPQNGSLSYSINWGDQNAYPVAMGAANMSASFVQTTTFTHAYSAAGTYTVSVTVQDSAGLSANTSTTVQIGNPVACTMEYAPVCGQPAEPACRHSVPACMIATQGPTTYGNMCQLNAAGATFLYNGQCANTY